MKIYAIRDRLLDYQMLPFPAETDKAAMASLANIVNHGRDNEAIKQAPHQFELYCLGEVLEDGHIEALRYLVCDVGSLIRPSLRGEPGTQPGGGKNESQPGANGDDATAAGSRPDTHQRPAQGETPPAAR